MGIRVLLIFVFLRFSLLHEAIAGVLHFNTYLLLIFGALTVAFTLIGGGIPRAMRHKAGTCWVAFSVFLILATVFSNWRGGSMDITTTFFKTDLPGYFGIAGLIVTWPEFRKLLYVMAAAGGLFIIETRILGAPDIDGRLGIKSIETVGNSNDLSCHLMFMITFLAVVLVSSRTPKLIRVLLAGLILLGLSEIMGTASRGALLAVVAGSIYVMVRGIARYRAVFGIVFALAIVGFLATISTSESNRFETIFADPARVDDNEAVGSKATRTYLLQKSIEFTMQHPILGLGPGEFGDTEGFAARAAGHRGAWQVTHNAYTEISSEAGIPALISVLIALFAVTSSLRRTMKIARTQGNNDIATTLFCISSGIAALLVGIFFLAMGFRVYLPTITGIGVAAVAAAQRQLALRTPTAPSTQPVPAFAPRPLAV